MSTNIGSERLSHIACTFIHPEFILESFDIKNKRINIILYVNATWLGFPSQQMENERKSEVELPIWSRATVWFDNRRVRAMNA
jgi:hypothetical protein